MKMRLLLASLVVVFLGCDSTSNLKDPNDSFFIKFYGGDGDQTGDDFVVLPDGSFILFGTTRASGIETTSQWYLVKTDAKGNVIWEKTYASVNNEEARDIEMTSDGRLVLLGNTYQSLNDRDVKIMTVTMDGTPIDTKIIPILTPAGINALGDEDASAVTQTNDGFIIAGSTTYVNPGWTPIAGLTDTHDAINIRLNNNLTTYASSWPTTQSNGFYSEDFSRKIYQLATGDFYVFGYSNSIPTGQTVVNYNFWYYQISSAGVSVNNRFVGLPSLDEKLSGVCIAPPESGGGYFLGGVAYNGSVASDIFIAQMRETLFLPPPPPPPAAQLNDFFYYKPLSINLGTDLPNKSSVTSTSQGGFYILSNEKSLNDNQNWLLTRTNNDGSVSWALPIVFGGEGFDISGGVQELSGGRIALIGTMRTGKPDVGELKMTLIKVNQDGKLAN